MPLWRTYSVKWIIFFSRKYYLFFVKNFWVGKEGNLLFISML